MHVAATGCGDGCYSAAERHMRIVGGKFRGRTLETPAHEGTRPTSDRVREAVFNILAHGIDDFSFDGLKVLDLFAGTGALGLEALSRGAASCLFVEEDAEARGLIRRNVEALGLTGVTKIFRRDATDLGEAGNRGDAGLVFLDPPYAQGLAERALASASAGGWLAPGAVAVIEERKGVSVTLPATFALLDRRTWGDTEVTFAIRQKNLTGSTQGPR
jgi:16S rRNA (guanine966-N2)-methyltransferase